MAKQDQHSEVTGDGNLIAKKSRFSCCCCLI